MSAGVLRHQPARLPGAGTESGSRTRRSESRAIGNDRDRDWESLVRAFRQDSRYEVRIATRRQVSKALHASNVSIAPAFGLKAARELYDWADVVVVPLRRIRMRRALTVVLEAVALGKPLIATDIGGLRDYFGPEHVFYVAASRVPALQQCACRDRRRSRRSRSNVPARPAVISRTRLHDPAIRPAACTPHA